MSKLSKRKRKQLVELVRSHYETMPFSDMLVIAEVPSRTLLGIFRVLKLRPQGAGFRAEELPPVVVPEPPPRLSALDFLPGGVGKAKKRHIDPRVEPDPPRPKLVRPPAVYSNTSPYGIAADYLLHPDKYDN